MAHAPGTSHPSWGSILLVEDEPIVALAARHALEDFGFRVRVAANGSSALHQARKAFLPPVETADAASLTTPPAHHAYTIRLAVVDVELPDISGLTVIRELRRLAADLPVIIASGRSWSELEDRLTGLQPVIWLGKPYDVSALRAALIQAGLPPEQG